MDADPAKGGTRAAGTRALRLAMVLPILSLEEAARLIPLREAAAREWLVREGLVRTIAGRRVVSWAAVHERLASDAAQSPRSPVAQQTGLPMSEIPERGHRRRST